MPLQWDKINDIDEQNSSVKRNHEHNRESENIKT